MRVTLAYGRRGLEVDLPDRHVVKCLQYQPAEPLADPQAAVERVLRQPIGTPPLAELARGCHGACVVVSDITRPAPSPVLLPPLLATLEASGIPRERILILVATGLHRPNLGAELVEMLGALVAEHYRVENHNGRDLSAHSFLGQSPRGVPIWIDSRYIEADLKIATGLIEPHFMAGFSGGRKLICPGLAALETIKVWHSPDFLEHPNARSGCLDGNPVHEENTWIARKAGCDFILNAVIDDQHRILKVVAGDMEASLLEGVATVRHVVVDTVPAPVDIVVTSSAGYPLDTTFYQSVKGMVAALPIVKPGGTIVLAASMTDGVGSADFQRLYAENPTLDGFMRRITDKSYFVVDQWQLEEFVKVHRQAAVKVVTDGLPPHILRGLFVDPAASVEQAVTEAIASYGPEATIAVIPKGPYVMAEIAAEP